MDSQAFRKDTWGAEIVPALTPRPQDIVVEGKRGLDAFASTNLDFILRSRGITTIALGGFLTNCCVESTRIASREILPAGKILALFSSIHWYVCRKVSARFILLLVLPSGLFRLRLRVRYLMKEVGGCSSR